MTRCFLYSNYCVLINLRYTKNRQNIIYYMMFYVEIDKILSIGGVGMTLDNLDILDEKLLNVVKGQKNIYNFN